MKKFLIFIVAYDAERHIASVFSRIPYDRLPRGTELLLIDDASKDATFVAAQEVARNCPIPCTLLKNPVNLGYGGNQKLGYEFAIKQGFDAVVLIHGDGQYAPELIPEMFSPIAEGKADLVLGSRMMRKQDAIKGGMPLYKWIGNQALTWLENRILGMELSEFHTGLRAYRVHTLGRIPFQLNTNDFHFDTDILIQFHRIGAKFHEIPIPTRYGDEVCHVDGWRYFFDCLRSCARDWMTQRGIFYCRKFDVDETRGHDSSKVDIFGSSHQLAVENVSSNSTILDLGGGNMWVAEALSIKKQCRVTVVDREFRQTASECVQRVELDLMTEFPEKTEMFDTVLALDILEHLPRKRQIELLEFLRRNQRSSTNFLICVPNTAFLPVRIVFFLLGHLNYGRQGILDNTHAFLFTHKTFQELLVDCGFSIKAEYFAPPPYELALGRTPIARLLTWVNLWLANSLPSLFAYQMVAKCQPLPTVDYLLQASFANSGVRCSIENDTCDRHVVSPAPNQISGDSRNA